MARCQQHPKLEQRSDILKASVSASAKSAWRTFHFYSLLLTHSLAALLPSEYADVEAEASKRPSKIR